MTKGVRLSKNKYYLGLFSEGEDCKSYWRLVKNVTNGESIALILGIRNADGKVVTSDLDKANILNYDTGIIQTTSCYPREQFV